MLHPFRVQYPQGSILSEFLRVEHGLFVVQVKVQVEGVVLGTGLAAGRTIEEAEDVARVRALETVLTTYSGEYARLDGSSSPDFPQIAAEVSPSQGIEPAPEPWLAQPNNLELAPQGVPPSKKTATKAVDNLLELSPPQSKKAATPLPSPSPATPLNESLPILETVIEAEAKLVGDNRHEESVPEASTLDDRAQPLASLPVPPEPTLPLAGIEESSEGMIAHPGAVVNEASDVGQAMVASIPSELVIPPVAPPELSVTATDPIDFSEVIAKSNMELKRLGWSSDQGRNYLLQTYGKRSRQLLSDEELLEFLLYLESLPTPVRA